MESGFISLQEKIFPTLLAISEQEQAKGLMHQSWPPPIMSFVYPIAKVSHFWMKNTPSPLDIVFCHKGKISQICKGEPYSTALIGANEFSDLVVEFPYGTVIDNNIKLGNKIDIIKPTKEELKKIFAQKGYNFIKY
jgi:uncharacterized membrane protein (UPF0127 family)